MNLQLVYGYILSLAKNENIFHEKKTKQTKGPKKRKKVSNDEGRTAHLKHVRYTRDLMRHDK